MNHLYGILDVQGQDREICFSNTIPDSTQSTNAYTYYGTPCGPNLLPRTLGLACGLPGNEHDRLAFVGVCNMIHSFIGAVFKQHSQ
jgi:hypothetical protein